MAQAKFSGDPKYWGPGVWLSIHTMAMAAKTPEEGRNFARQVRTIVDRLPCEDCARKAKKFIETNPPETYAQSSDDLGMFRWSWIFHNNVNQDIGKTPIAWEDALEMFSASSVCTTGCGEPSTPTPTPTSPPGIYYPPHIARTNVPWMHEGIAPVVPSGGVVFSSQSSRSQPSRPTPNPPFTYLKGYGW